MSIEAELARVRADLDRVTPAQAVAEMENGAVLIDTRPEYQRRADGDVPGAIVIERNHLEWRLDTMNSSRIPEAVSADVRWIVMCDEGYASSLAAASLRAIGLPRATDLDGGFQRWRAEGHPVRLGGPVPARIAVHDKRAESAPG